MPKPAIEMIVVVIAILAFVAVVIWILAAVHISKSGVSGGSILNTMWDAIKMIVTDWAAPPAP
jgi:hypothetical protein